MTTMDAGHSRGLLERVLADPPRLHRGELEISRPFDPSESLLPVESVRRIVEAGPTCYSVHRKVAEFIFDHVQPDWRTLEVGLGVSTLTFALRGARHVSITPFSNEIEQLRQYARALGVSLEGIEFVAESSDAYLPRCSHRDLDLVLIDGKHAFPFPIVDWYYTADRLRRGGLMLIDDAQMKPVRILQEFMDSDPRWERVEMIIEKTFAFRKLTDTVHDTAWHMQPYVFQGLKDHALQKRSLWWRARNRVRRLLAAGQA
jgi:hypothetical protein